MKTLCKHCNNANKIGDNKNDYICLGGSRERIREFEKDARQLKKDILARRRYFNQ